MSKFYLYLDYEEKEIYDLMADIMIYLDELIEKGLDRKEVQKEILKLYEAKGGKFSGLDKD